MKSKNQCSGCAILVCQDEDTRNKILSQQHRVFDRIIECHEYRRGTKLKSYNQDLWKKRIFVKNIPLYFSNIKLKEVFESIGTVLIASITRPKSGIKKPCHTGFITFKEENHAKKALSMKIVNLQDGVTLYIDKCISNKNNKKVYQRTGARVNQDHEDKEKIKKQQQNHQEMYQNQNQGRGVFNMGLLDMFSINNLPPSNLNLPINQQLPSRLKFSDEDSDSETNNISSAQQRLRDITKQHLIKLITENHRDSNIQIKQVGAMEVPMNRHTQYPGQDHHMLNQNVNRSSNTPYQWGVDHRAPQRYPQYPDHRINSFPELSLAENKHQDYTFQMNKKQNPSTHSFNME